MSRPQKVDDIWWEGNDLLMESEGSVWRFINARVTNIEYGPIECDTIQITEIPVDFVKIET